MTPHLGLALLVSAEPGTRETTGFLGQDKNKVCKLEPRGSRFPLWGEAMYLSGTGAEEPLSCWNAESWAQGPHARKGRQRPPTSVTRRTLSRFIFICELAGLHTNNDINGEKDGKSCL